MEALLEVKHLRKTFGKRDTAFAAVNDISFSVGAGECVGLVGESGSGKSTTARLLTRILDADEGTMRFDGVDYTGARGKQLRPIYRQMQMVFQSPQDSFDPRKKLGFSLTEGLRNRGVSKQDAKIQAEAIMKTCGLSAEYLERYPHEVSGGECQRAAIARAALLTPRLLICDEVTSALDVTVQAQILELLQGLRKETALSCLFISHDLAVVQQMCSRILVMYQGKIIEEGTTEEVLKHPKQPYTQKLVDSVLDW